MSLLVAAGLVSVGSGSVVSAGGAGDAGEALLVGSTGSDAAVAEAPTPASRIVGLLPVEGGVARELRAVVPPADGAVPVGGGPVLRSIALPSGSGLLGVPEVVLAAYRNAELALASAQPGCGVSWNLLAGIGRIESGHAGGGRTDAAGTTVSPIFGPALDGSLPGNEVIAAAGGGFVRAVGPMQFLPSTWALYAADGNGDGVSDPHNVFDAALGAGKYLCSGGLDLRDRAQELRAVLRYNNSMSYAADVLSWSAAYRTGGSPSAGRVSPEAIAPGSGGWGTAPGALLTSAPVPGSLVAEAPEGLPLEQAVQTPTPAAVPEPMITIPGLPPIPCGIFCPPPPPPVVPPGEPGPRAEELPREAPVPAPQPAVPPEEPRPGPVPVEFGPDGQPVAPAPDPATPPPPGLVLPFGITIPLPVPPAPAP
ncbi:lytic transglycosylase domain-containing protein [Nocardia harenae]|uniref:lytic transglycosylase domain-containing protein n=1 Tax=Nocardia harenae TaxID=358707 RepID=UPI001FE0F7FD|nr:lytic murein transglycosylase [Nocardia harenae]